MDAHLTDGLKKIAQDSLSIDFPTAPTFKLESLANTGYGERGLNFDFYLINKDDLWLERNFRFLTAFYAGTQWLQMTGRIY
jgi:hypothetical protein